MKAACKRAAGILVLTELFNVSTVVLDTQTQQAHTHTHTHTHNYGYRKKFKESDNRFGVLYQHQYLNYDITLELCQMFPLGETH